MATSPPATGHVYLNFVDGEERRQRTQEGFTPENFRRLTQIKAKYDPENVFSHSFSIQPAADGEA